MKGQIKRNILLALLGLVMASPASANGWIFGANTGTMVIDVSGVSNPTNVGFMAGYEIGIGIGDLAFEAEMTNSVSSGSAGSSDVDIDTRALYVALRTAGPVYFKGRMGTLQEEISISGFPSETDNGSSIGVGVGFSLGLVQLELDYTVIEQDVNYLSVGVVF